MGRVRNCYNEVSGINAETPTMLVSYRAPLGKTTYLQKIEASGDNFATFEVRVNNEVQAKKRTYYTGFNAELEFTTNNENRGFPLKPGDVVTISVIHSRGHPATFSARILVLEL